MRILLILFLLASSAIAGDVQTKRSAVILDRPSKNGKIVTRVRRGKKFSVTGQEKAGFVRLKTKSGKALWISKRALEPAYDAEADLETSGESTRPNQSFRRLTVDFGASTGSQNGVSFFEANIGANYFFLHWLSWRNAIFYHTGSGLPSFFGLDSSVRGHLRKGMFNAHLGLGYRLQTNSTHAPFGEVGVILAGGGLRIGANVKYVAFSATSAGASDQLIYSIILAGGGSLF